MTMHAQMDPRTGILPCCSRHYLSVWGTGDHSTDNPAEVTCEGDDDAR